MTLSEQLREWRRRWQLTQPAAAVVLGVNVETLRNWEQGRNAPTAAGLQWLRWKLEQPPE